MSEDIDISKLEYSVVEQASAIPTAFYKNNLSKIKSILEEYDLNLNDFISFENSNFYIDDYTMSDFNSSDKKSTDYSISYKSFSIKRYGKDEDDEENNLFFHFYIKLKNNNLFDEKGDLLNIAKTNVFTIKDFCNLHEKNKNNYKKVLNFICKNEDKFINKLYDLIFTNKSKLFIVKDYSTNLLSDVTLNFILLLEDKEIEHELVYINSYKYKKIENFIYEFKSNVKDNILNIDNEEIKIQFKKMLGDNYENFEHLFEWSNTFRRYDLLGKFDKFKWPINIKLTYMQINFLKENFNEIESKFKDDIILLTDIHRVSVEKHYYKKINSRLDKNYDFIILNAITNYRKVYPHIKDIIIKHLLISVRDEIEEGIDPNTIIEYNKGYSIDFINDKLFNDKTHFNFFNTQYHIERLDFILLSFNKDNYLKYSPLIFKFSKWYNIINIRCFGLKIKL